MSYSNNNFASIQEAPFSIVKFNSYQTKEKGRDITFSNFKLLCEQLYTDYNSQGVTIKSNAACYLFGSSNNNGRKSADIISRNIIALDLDYVRPVASEQELHSLLNLINEH